MPLQKVPMVSVDAFLDEDARQARQASEKLCREGRRECERKNAFVQSVLAVCVVVAALVAYLLWGG